MIEISTNPPSRREEEDFPKTTTIPEGWITESLVLEVSSSNPNGEVRSVNLRTLAKVEDESLIKRQFEPFPQPSTYPSGWDLSTM